jgi:Predicted membrane protein
VFKGGDTLEGIWNSVEELSASGFALRTLIVGVMLYIASRFLPQRSGGQYAGFDFTFFWMMGGLIASPLFDSRITFTNTITAAVTIYFMHYLISFLAVKSRTFARIVIGRAEVLVAGGQIQKKTMLKSLMPIELLLAQLREADAANLSEVEMAIHETNGRVSVLKKSDHLPVTAGDLNIKTVESGLPTILVNDGKVLDKNLRKLGYDKKWLKEQLLKFGTADIKNVYLATIDGTGEIYCSLSK